MIENIKVFLIKLAQSLIELSKYLVWSPPLRHQCRAGRPSQKRGKWDAHKQKHNCFFIPRCHLAPLIFQPVPTLQLHFILFLLYSCLHVSMPSPLASYIHLHPLPIVCWVSLSLFIDACSNASCWSSPVPLCFPFHLRFPALAGQAMTRWSSSFAREWWGRCNYRENIVWFKGSSWFVLKEVKQWIHYVKQWINYVEDRGRRKPRKTWDM